MFDVPVSSIAGTQKRATHPVLLGPDVVPVADDAGRLSELVQVEI